MSVHPNQLFNNIVKTSELDSQDAFTEIPAGKGVILFAHDQSPVQLLATANIRKAVLNRLQQDQAEEPSRKIDISSIVTDIYYSVFPNDFDNKLFYHRAAHTLFGHDAKEWITLPRQTYAMVNLDDPCPSFRITDKACTESGRIVFGLFPTRKAATQYAEILNFVFSLCRNPSQFKHSQSCPYAQMNRCLGFCTGKIGKEDYLRFVHEAVKVTEGQTEHHLEFLHAQMKHYGIKQEFEKAQLVKEKIEQLESLEGSTFTWTSKLEDLCILHIDKGNKLEVEGKKRKQKTYNAYLITSKSIRLLSSISLEAIQAFIDYLPAVKPTDEIRVENLGEHLGTLSWFLYRSNQTGMWINLANRKRLDKQALLQQFAETFKVKLDD